MLMVQNIKNISFDTSSRNILETRVDIKQCVELTHVKDRHANYVHKILKITSSYSHRINFYIILPKIICLKDVNSVVFLSVLPVS
jgi:hypothetical protein